MRIPEVDGYQVKAARDDGDDGGVQHVSIYYASLHEKQFEIVMSAHRAESSFLNLIGPTEEVNGHLVYSTGSGDDTYSATTIVDGIAYDIDTIRLPGGDPKSLASARDAFVAAVTRR